MPLTNTATRYGAVTKTFHWLSALLIFTAFPLGWLASSLAERIADPAISSTDIDLARATTLFSLHKTIGVSLFTVAILRILWTLAQPKPGLLNGDERTEAWLAETVHWLLYGSLVLVPLTGWIHHAAADGFAPIWWPFGQSLPFIPKSPSLSELFSTLHFVFQLVLAGAIALHVAGALKHHLIERDATLRRMLFSGTSGMPTTAQPSHLVSVLSALVIWAGALGAGGAAGLFSPHTPPATTAALQAVESDWQVENGTLSLTATQLGHPVTGSFADWTASITYAEDLTADRNGAVKVTVSIPSLTLGSVTAQAMGPDYFDADSFVTAVFEADILRDGDDLRADGTLTIKDHSVPISLPFVLDVQDDTATASGQVTLDRRAFGIGAKVEDEGTLAFSVLVEFTLVAHKAP
ncbi:cytochrome b/b6 domain-containing protein [Thalassovita taeanensis]|uniref:Cytochrome b561 n=1 Tax=Thalassovita taeanensis TaxID=657014 RepID=A0A1H9HRC0_9RHOB|nr:cytochrome b/b6 domain-containing protein [Thalassovita taeanensis]SEQ64818.1 Cytochrome b561 [Thalassovita taeanensis]